MAGHGQRLQQALNARRVAKLYALAVELGVDQSALSRWKNGGPISATNAARLCQALDISLDWLLLGRGTMDQHRTFSITRQESRLIDRLKGLSPEALIHLLNFVDTVATENPSP